MRYHFQPIAVLGCGSSGMATAAYLTQAGHRVILCDIPEQAGDFEAIRQQGGITLSDENGQVTCTMPWQLTTDFAQALQNANLVLVCVSAARHQELARIVAPLAREDHVFLLTPGNFGAFLFRRELDSLKKESVVVGERCGCLWACRRRAPGEVFSASPLKEGTVAALPSRDTQNLIAAFQGILPLKAGKNVLEVSLNSPNVISHVAGTVLNAAQVERRGEDFAFFRDGLSESVIQTFAQLEQERDAVFAKLELSVYGPPSEGLMRTLMGENCPPGLLRFKSLEGPSSFSHRYVSEDAACGMAMLVSLGETYGVPVPLSRAYLMVAQSINHTDYLRQGRTLKNLSLTGLSPEALLEKL